MVPGEGNTRGALFLSLPTSPPCYSGISCPDHGLRCELVRALRCVDKVIPYTDVNEIIKCTDFDIFAVGADQNHSGFLNAIEYCYRNGKKVVQLQRTPNISSSAIKGVLKHF